MVNGKSRGSLFLILTFDLQPLATDQAKISVPLFPKIGSKIKTEKRA
jgi:hypothetical protein